jgi:hypothetical protein
MVISYAYFFLNYENKGNNLNKQQEAGSLPQREREREREREKREL